MNLHISHFFQKFIRNENADIHNYLDYGKLSNFLAELSSMEMTPLYADQNERNTENVDDWFIICD